MIGFFFLLKLYTYCFLKKEKKMSSGVKSLLELAHKSKNPLETLEHLLIEHPTMEMVDALVPEDSVDLSRSEDCHLITDIKAYFEQRNDPCSTVGWRCKFVYFATSMCHVFGRRVNELFYPFGDSHVITYVFPNCPMPYIWLDINEKAQVTLVRHYKMPSPWVNLSIHTIGKARDLSGSKLSVELASGKITPQKGIEDSIQVSLRLDLKIVGLVRPNPAMNCVIMLTYNMVFNGIYYKSKYPLITALHAITTKNPANKS